MRLSERCLAALALLSLVALGGCSTNDPVPACVECERWFRVSPVLGRHPSPHPLDSAYILFSTVEKPDSTASDAARQDDEDIWLTWIEDREDGNANAVVGRSLFAITDDDFGPTGANTTPRWSPSGTRLAWLHGPADGGTQIWARDILVPVSRGEAPVLGVPMLVADDARDPAWLSEDSLLFTRQNKIYRIDVAGGPGSETQVSFDPPSYASNDKYLDRHPDVASDGAIVFRSALRLPVADIYVEAFEVLSDGTRVPTDAFVSYQPPTAGTPTFPVVEAGEPLRTPVLMRGIPIRGNGVFEIGASLERFVVMDSTRENYCDTTIVVERLLQADTVDTVSIDFEIVRAALSFVTESTNATIFWTRQDGRVSINDFGGTRTIDRCARRTYDCLLPWAIGPDGEIRVGVPETYTVTAVFQDRQEIRDVTLSPGDTTFVVLFDNPDFTCNEPAPVPGPAVSTDPAGGALSRGRSDDPLRAPGERSNVWRLELGGSGVPAFREILGSRDGLIQTPVVTREFPGGVRYLAWISDETGDWQLSVQRLLNWAADGSPFVVPVPGTFDNLSCPRNVFNPQWTSDSAPGALRLVVTMTECPDNEFPDIGFDQDPWPIGELRIWTVDIDDYQ